MSKRSKKLKKTSTSTINSRWKQTGSHPRNDDALYTFASIGYPWYMDYAEGGKYYKGRGDSMG